MQKLSEFKKELSELLNKHGARLKIMLEGDTHAIWGEGIGVSFDNAEVTSRLSDCYELHHSDI